MQGASVICNDISLRLLLHLSLLLHHPVNGNLLVRVIELVCLGLGVSLEVGVEVTRTNGGEDREDDEGILMTWAGGRGNWSGCGYYCEIRGCGSSK